MTTHRTLFSKSLAAGAFSALLAVGSSGGAWAIAGVDFPSHNMQEAQAEIESGNFEESRSMLEEILRFEPENADAYNLLGYSLRNLGEMELSMENYVKALAIDPKHANALEYQGELFLKMGQQADAEKNLVLISEICSGDCEAKTELQAAIERFKDGKFTWTQAAGAN
jgi:tetratricopeptide (TPR) repeat protein